MNKKQAFVTLISLTLILGGVFLLVAFFQKSTPVVEFSDPGLEEAVREAIEKHEGTITYKDIQNLQVLDASNRQIEDLDGIEVMTELRDINLENNFVKSVSPLKSLMKLQNLNLRNNEITKLEDIDFQDIIYLNLHELSLRHNVKRDSEGEGERIEDISLLKNMVSLKKLELRDNHIKDLSPLSNLRKLLKVDVRENKFTSIKPLETLTRLENLNIRDNATESLEPLRYLTKLKKLNIHSNFEIDSLDPIKGLVNLETLIMQGVQIKDRDFLKKFTKLQRLNAIDTGVEILNPEITERLLANGGLQEEVRPSYLLHTIESPTFSYDTGFYTKGFSLELTTEESTSPIYYTLDGSEPTLNSDVYTGPLSIEEQGAETATIVRAKILTEKNTMSETITKTYFTHPEIETRFDLPVFSLVTDPKNLFDEKKGIYINENAFNRGSEWERPIDVEYMDSNGVSLLKQNAGIRIHGGTSRGARQKSLRLYAKSEYDPQATFENVFFDDLQKMRSKEPIASFKHLLLRNSGNDNSQTMFNDGFMQELVAPLETFDTQAYQPAVIFINGEYYGIQNIRERLDEYYVQSHYDIDTNDIAILENNSELYRGGNKDVYHYNNMLAYIEENGVQEKQHLDYVETQMDFDSFIDYYASEIYFGNADWPGNNIQYWRKTTDEYVSDAPYGHDGRWRWMMLDTDFGFYRSDDPFGYNEQPLNYMHNTIEWVMNEYDGVKGSRTWPNFLFRELMQNDTFKNKFLIRFNDIANGYLNQQTALNKIEEKVELLEDEMPRQIKAWGTIESIDAWQTYIDRKKTFAKERAPFIRQFIMEEFNLEDTVRVNVENETESGYVRLNTLDIKQDLPGNKDETLWSGTYFQGVPLSVEAIAKEGYVFSHWQGQDGKTTKLEFIPNEKEVYIKPVFSKE